MIINLISFAPVIAQDSQEVIKGGEIQSNLDEDFAQNAESVKLPQTRAPHSAYKSKFQEFVVDNSLTQPNTFSDGTLPEEITFAGVEENAMDQVTSVSQLSDIQPTDWAFQALQSLVKRYGVK